MKQKKINIKEFLTRGVVKVIEKKNIEKKLGGRKKLRVKHGIDPTTPDLHLGYGVVYERLRTLQQVGHTIILIIGDFTGRFGDPSDKLRARPLRTKQEVRKISKNYLKQLSCILDVGKVEVRYNSEWYDRMKPEEFLRLFSHFTIRRMLERDMFQKRVQHKRDIRLHEPLYPALQAYDSVAIHSDLTVIGSDQLFNELQARKLQKDFRQPPQDIIALEMLLGIRGVDKMSQSLGNYIGFADSPGEQFGKIMSIPDSLVCSYFKLVTRVDSQELPRIKKEITTHPRDSKVRLAREIVSIYHGPGAAEEAQNEFNDVFQKHQVPPNIPNHNLIKGTYLIPELLVKFSLSPSKTEAKRLCEQGAVKINGAVVRDWKMPVTFKKETLVQVGKKRFIKVKVK